MSYIYVRNGEEFKFESRSEYIKFRRGFDSFGSVEAMVEHLDRKGYFSQYGWKRSFINFYISDYGNDPLHDLLTPEEIQQLRDYQSKLRAEAKAADEAREWKLVDTLYWADNSVEQIWEDKDGIRKTVMPVGPHGDTC